MLKLPPMPLTGGEAMRPVDADFKPLVPTV
jgi:hypothetical protein